MDSSQDFKSLQDKIQAALVATTRKVNLVASQDVTFRRSLDPDAGEQLDEQRTKLLRLAGALVKTAADLSHAKANAKAPSLEDADDIEIHWRSIVDAIDIALEKADTCIDEYSGLVKRKDAPTQEMSSGPQSKRLKSGPLDRSLRFANITKPQRIFDVQPNNFEEGPWKPILTKKPHATVPLEQSFGSFQDDNGDTQYDYLFNLSFLVAPPSEEDSKLPKRRAAHQKKIRNLRVGGSTHDANGNPRYKNPYETEILRMKYPAGVYEVKDAIPFAPMEKSSAVYVDTFEGVLKMLEELKKAKEIAVDLEHHDYRTYAGLLSLMQISTRNKDWVVDTLKPWRRRLEVLNEVFADPAILKVFHGAYMDIKWLQRDLGLYIVGLFDTFSAADALHYPGKSLAYLLKKFVNFEADKRYQLADWRIRPLPEEMLYYARSDTHFLLYVYDMMRNELVRQSIRRDPTKDLIEIALQNSKQTALSRYEPPRIDHETGQGSRGWLNSLSRMPPGFTREQFSVYRAVHRWRDDLARRQDESPFFIMSQTVLTEVARAMPSTIADLVRTTPNVSHAVKSLLGDLFGVVQDAIKIGADGPTVLEVLKADTADGVASMTIRGFTTGDKSSATAQDDNIPSATEMTSKESQLWGKVPMSTLWDKVTEASRAVNNQPIAIPWTNFVANAQVATEDYSIGPMQVDEAGDREGIPTSSEVAPPEAAASAANEEFTLRSGRPSAAATAEGNVDSSTSSESDSDDDDDEDSEEMARLIAVQKRMEEEKKRRKEEKQQMKLKLKEEKAARRAERKAQQQAAKKGAASAAAEGEESNGDDDQEEGEVEDDGGAPFDYSKAASVLHSQSAAKGTESRSGIRAKVYNPYAAKTTAEGPKPARRMNFEKAGKSATFKK